MAKSIMIQGTMSNAGKSLIAAGLCRIFKQDGYKVAPFKSQNMALNSYVTSEGLEMGRAQVVQAMAAGVEPSVRMNPILLKPTTDMGSQVIVQGQVVGNMRAMDYFAKKKEYIPVIRESYEQLAADHDIIVIEGAGSPAEINLKQDDIVNMGMAKIADAPVLLVGDIDRGGVFAQLIGTVMLLEPEEQARIKGLIVNKFRGDKKILDPGITMLEERAGKPVLGVVPYADVDIEDEDSLASSLEETHIQAEIDVAVIRFPRISNFTDMQALSMERDVSVRYVTKPSELGEPDVILLPGTKIRFRICSGCGKADWKQRLRVWRRRAPSCSESVAGIRCLANHSWTHCRRRVHLVVCEVWDCCRLQLCLKRKNNWRTAHTGLECWKGILCHSAIRKLPVMRYTWGGRKLLAKLQPPFILSSAIQQEPYSATRQELWQAVIFTASSMKLHSVRHLLNCCMRAKGKHGEKVNI